MHIIDLILNDSSVRLSFWPQNQNENSIFLDVCHHNTEENIWHYLFHHNFKCKLKCK